MRRYVIVGNSGSGKSTLAMRLACGEALPHLDLDTLAWEPTTPPSRRAVADSTRAITSFMDANDRWVIEGCYADLLEVPLPCCARLLFLNPGIEACIANARARPWEPHKYLSKDAQDANLEMLIGWIRDYGTRRDAFSLAAHRALFDGFVGEKIELTSREKIRAFSAVGTASALGMQAREKLVLGERFPSQDLTSSAVDRSVQPSTLFFVEVVLLVGENEVYLAAFRKIDWLIENEPAAVHTSSKRQSRHQNASI